MGGGAWPFLVGGVICLVDSVNERDLNLLNSYANRLIWGAAIGACTATVVATGCESSDVFVDILLRGTIRFQRMEV